MMMDKNGEEGDNDGSGGCHSSVAGLFVVVGNFRRYSVSMMMVMLVVDAMMILHWKPSIALIDSALHGF